MNLNNNVIIFDVLIFDINFVNKKEQKIKNININQPIMVASLTAKFSSPSQNQNEYSSKVLKLLEDVYENTQL